MDIKSTLILVFVTSLFWACKKDETNQDKTDTGTELNYSGTGFITQGLAETVVTNLLECQRVAGIGKISDADGNSWTVPAEVNYTNSSFPFASNLNNGCAHINYTTAEEALSHLDGSDIIEIDADGEVITAFVFADNYFEMYINGTPVGKDNVPYTEFNSDIVRFKVNRPFTITMKLVDWEENLGIGTEENHGFTNHAGDGGMVAVFKNTSNEIIATTDDSWTAQTFYTAPVKDLTCLSESGSRRLSSTCDEEDSNDGSRYYAVHWKVPDNWTNSSFDDGDWPSATTYTNQEIGVDNKPAYTNFTDIFDDPTNDAEFIWSTNVVLDNEVIVRKTVE